MPPTPAPVQETALDRGQVLRAVALGGLDLQATDLTRADLQGVVLAAAQLIDVRAHGVRLRTAGLQGLQARGLRARDADLESAQLQSADLRDADLRGAILLDAGLNGADLRGADLRATDLRNADLRDARLDGARLEGADLTGADLTGASVGSVLASSACLTRAEDGGTGAIAHLLSAGAYTGLHPLIAQLGTLGGAAGRRVSRGLRAARSLGRAQQETAREGAVDGAAGVLSVLAERAAAARTRRRREREASDARRKARLDSVRARRQAEADAREQQRAKRRRRAAARAAERRARRGRSAALASRETRLAPASTPTLRPGAAPALPSMERAARRRAERDALAASPALREAMSRASHTARARRAESRSRAAARTLLATRAAEQRARLEAQAAQAREEASRQAAAAEAAQRRAEAEALRQAEERARMVEAIRAEAAQAARRAAEAEAQRRALQQRDRREREAAALAARPRRIDAARAEEAEALRTRRRPAPRFGSDNVLPRAQRPVPPGLLPAQRDRLGRLARVLQRESERQHEADLPLGPGADLAGADLRGRRLGDVPLSGANLAGACLDAARMAGADLGGADLTGASLESVRLEQASLRAASAEGARLDGGRLRDTDLRDAILDGASLVDADLRGADLRGVRLEGADLTGADLRRALLDGASLRGADLSAARLSDVDLSGVVLDEARFDQTDLAGARLEGASVHGAILEGALGLSGRDRDRLAAAGARAADPGLEALLGRFAPKQLRYAAAILALGVGSWFIARYVSDGTLDAATLEVEAEALRSTDPLQASAAYAALAEDAVRVDNRVGYLIEAASLAGEGGEPQTAQTLFTEALETAADSPGLSGDVRLRMGAFQLAQQAWAEARETAAPLLTSDGHPAETRARAVLLVRAARSAAGEQGADPAVLTLFEALSELPEPEADLRIALALLHAARGEFDPALQELDAAATLDLPADLARKTLETRANVLDQAGQEDASAAVWATLMAEALRGSPEWQTARLALADLRLRQARMDDARGLVGPLLEAGAEPRVLSRALLVAGRLAEQEQELTAAARHYQRVLTLPVADADTEEDARLSLARVLLTGDEATAEAALAALPEEAAAGILAHARLGEARRLLDEGDPAGALTIYEDLGTSSEAAITRDARSGQAEALAQVGELDAAIRIWRDLLAEAPSAEERIGLELQLAHGLLQGGDIEESTAAFRGLSESDDPDVRFQGLLGLAEVARAQGESERARTLFQLVADQSPDPAYQVHALQELADLAAAQERTTDALEALRALVATAPPGSSAAAEARLSLVLALGDAGAVDEALRLCSQAEATAQTPLGRAHAALACAELLERTDEAERSARRYAAVHEHEGLPTDVRTDAWLGEARTMLQAGDARTSLAATEAGLAQVETPSLRLPLLAARVQALRSLERPEALQSALEERDALAAEVPALAGPLLIDAAATARGRGQPDVAVDLLERAIALPLNPEARAGALVELGDTLLEAGRLADAALRFEAAGETEGVDETTRFAAGMGRAEVLRQQGDLERTAEVLADLDPPGVDAQRWWLETRARVLAEQDDADGAQEAWRALAAASSDAPASRAAALLGEADLLLGGDEPAAALPLYLESAALAPEAAGAGWATLGAVEAQLMLERREEAASMLARLREHDDPEVALQARLREAALSTEHEDWEAALALLSTTPDRDLGPGWDASFVELAAAAHAGAGDLGAARDVWEGLAERWPDSKEALLPAWLGLADIALAEGEPDRARAWAARALEGADDPGYRQRAEDLVARLGG